MSSVQRTDVAMKEGGSQNRTKRHIKDSVVYCEVPRH